MQRIVIDTDGGIDDALALLYALASPGVRIEAITTVHGNVPLQQATRNVFEVLSVARRSLEVAAGAEAPLHSERVHATEVHGRDGLSGWTAGRPPSACRASDTPAWVRIAELARQYPGEITLITLGPLTNVALGLRSDPAAYRLLKRIVAMGGAVSVPGNITPTAEFNIYCDPLAARETLRSGIPLALVGLDATRQVALTEAQLAAWLEGRDDGRADFLRAICRSLFAFYRARVGTPMCYLHDPLAVGLALDTSLAATRRMPLEIGEHGETLPGTTPADVAVTVDVARFLESFERLVIHGNRAPSVTV